MPGCRTGGISTTSARQLVNDAGLAADQTATQMATPPWTTGEAGLGGHSGASSQSSAADLSAPVIGLFTVQGVVGV
jgi:hypothetical protein